MVILYMMLMYMIWLIIPDITLGEPALSHAYTNGTTEFAWFHLELLFQSVQGDNIGPLSMEAGTPVNGANSGDNSDQNNNGSSAGRIIVKQWRESWWKLRIRRWFK
jgi:hypothetical protein